MKKINVIVKDEETLELLEAAEPGDIIDLKEVMHISTKYIESLVEKEKNKEFKKLLETEKKIIEANHKLECQQLQNEIKLLQEISLKEKEEIKQKMILDNNKECDKLLIKINNLKTEMDILSLKFENEKKEAVNNAISEEQQKYEKVKRELDILSASLRQQLQLQEKDLSSKHQKEVSDLIAKNEVTISKMEVEKAEALNEQKEKYHDELLKKDELINNLQRQKAMLNVKQTGEDLESWCDNEVSMYMQNGLTNCKWYKDNSAVKEDEDDKKTKADFIFEIYATSNKKEDELLTNVCLEMKDENPDSKTKHTNKSHYKKLDNDRNKKGCKYAVLVSNLEMDKSNIIPIFKVNEYENMYVVRPGYLMVFLNMITSLTTRFAELYLKDKKTTLEIIKKEDLIEIFESIKKKYLDAPLSKLVSSLDKISTSSGKIREANEQIESECNNIRFKYISDIEKKLNDFSLNLNKKIIKKME